MRLFEIVRVNGLKQRLQYVSFILKRSNNHASQADEKFQGSSSSSGYLEVSISYHIRVFNEQLRFRDNTA